MNFVPLYIFDLDGTLSDPTHRRHLVSDGRRDWDEFYRQSSADPVNSPVARTFRLLKNYALVWVWSARSDVVRDDTIKWLRDNRLEPNELRMRKHGDWTPDETLKELWLREMAPDMRRRLVAVYDDRRKVVDMWRRNGIACFQVAPGVF